MICPTCQAAADAHAPRDQHCTTTGGPGAACDCQHRTDRYQPRRGFGMPAALHDGMRAAAERLLTAAPLTPAKWPGEDGPSLVSARRHTDTTKG